MPMRRARCCGLPGLHSVLAEPRVRVWGATGRAAERPGKSIAVRRGERHWQVMPDGLNLNRSGALRPGY